MAKRRRRSRTPAKSDLDALAILVASIQDGLSAHGSTLAARGRSYVSRVGDFSWSPGGKFLCCPVQGTAAKPYQVSLERSEKPLMLVDAYCSCPYSDQWSYCKHTYAALLVLEQRLLDAADPLRERVLGIKTMEAWEAAVSEIDRFLCRRGENAEQQSTEPTSRLVWRADYRSVGGGSMLDIVPYEQKYNAKRQTWSRGRKVSWDRLGRSQELWTTTADQQIGETLVARRQYEYYSYSYGGYQPPLLTLLEQLVGHPHVYWANDISTQVEVASASLGLAIQTDRKGMSVSVALDGKPPTAERDCFIIDEGSRRGAVAVDLNENRITLAAADSDLLELVQRLSDIGARFPKAKKEELLSRLSALESVVPVSLPESLLGGSVEADSRTVLRLTPQEIGGLVAEMKVRPAADSVALEPGGGPPEISTIDEGQRVRVCRDLEQEAAAARSLAEELALTQYPETRPWQWQLLSDEAALDLVAAVGEPDDSKLLVEWPEGARLSISREVTPQSLRVEIEDRKDWFGLNGKIVIDGEEIPLKVLLAGIRAGERYIAIGKHKWIRIAQAFRDRLSALGDMVHEGRGGLEFDLTAAPVLDELLDDEVTLKASRNWKQLVSRFSGAAELSPDPPISLMAELRDYQLEGYRWLRRLAAWGVGGILADDMGLGKTVQALAVLIDRMEEGPALVVAPTSVGFNWIREAKRFAPTLQGSLYRETDRGEFLGSVGDGDLVVVSYGLLLRDAEKLAAVNWGTLVLDEAQHIKNSQTKTARAARQLDAKWRMALTGTPIENHLGELWSLFRAISPGLFGSWDRFRERFAEPIEKRKDTERRHALARTVRPFILRRTKSEVLDELPDRTEMRLTAELSAPERKKYEDVRLSAVAELAGIAKQKDGRDHRFEVLAALTRLRQLACHPKLVDAGWNGSSAKLDLLLEVVDELVEGNHRALVFSQFTQHLALIREALDRRGISYRYLDGATTAKKRMAEVDAFQHGQGQLFLISLKAGGTGLNLTGADYVIHMDPWWNPAVEDQATDRAHRIGQTRPVTVYRLVAQDTIEEQILALHADKRDLVSGVLDGTDKAGKLSTEELIGLIRAGGQNDQRVVPAPKGRKGKARRRSSAVK